MAADIGRLSRRLVLGVSLLIITPAVIAGMYYASALRAQILDLRSEEIERRGNWAGDQIVLRLDQLWQQISTMSKKVDMSRLDELRQQFTLIRQIDDRFSWIGIADAEGKVLISSNGMLENASVAQRPWFQRGLAGPYAGDVHEAVLLQNLLPKRDEPYRFIDFSAPIQNDKGETVGVLGAHFDWVWMIKLVDSFRSAQEDIILLSQDLRILHGPTALYGKQFSVQPGDPGGSGTRLEQWPDGQVFLTEVAPIRTKAGAPTFGWSLGVRSAPAMMIEDAGKALRTFWTLLGGALAITVLGTVAFIVWATSGQRPILAPETGAPRRRGGHRV
jgi:hypothetical protein